MRAEVAEHAARHLIGQDVDIHPLVGRTGEGGELAVNFLEVRAQAGEPLAIVVGTAGMTCEQRHHAQGVRLGRAIGKRHDGCLDRVDSGLDGREIGGSRQAGGVVAVQDDRNAEALFQRGNQLVGHFRRDQAGHVLDADRLAAHVDEGLAELDEGLGRVHRADGVANLAPRLLAGRQGRTHSCGKIPRVVQGIENAQHIHAAIGRAVDESLDHVIGEAGVLHDVLPPQQHGMRRVRGALLERGDARKGVFPEVAQAGINRRPAPRFELKKAKGIKVGQGREHLLRFHPCGSEGLVPVPEHRVGEGNGFTH